MPNQIIIYGEDTPQNGFDNNGLAVLRPTSCQITEQINGKWVLNMEHPIDPDGVWRTLNAFSHIKAMGQIFDIKSVTHDYKGLSGKVIVYAEHVFYKMNDFWIFPESIISGSTANQILQSIKNNSETMPFPGSVDYDFTFDSDVPVYSLTKEEKNGCTMVEAILGRDGFFGLFGGELYRDNFYFSMKQEMEGCRHNAFEIRVGLNMRGVRRTIDVSTFCSYFKGYDNHGNWFAVSFDASSYSGLPIQNSVIRSMNFQYDTDDPTIAMRNLQREVLFYWNSYLKPNITYDVDLIDTRNVPGFEPTGQFRFKVGDYGRLYDDRIGGSLELRITETVTDAITGETLKVKFGDLQGFMKESGYVPVPPFPDIPEPPIDETKIAMIHLDITTDEPTGVLDYVSTAREMALYLEQLDSSTDRVWMRIGTDSITSFGNFAVMGPALRKVSILSNMPTIEYSASGYGYITSCANLKEIEIPTVKVINAPFITNCPALTDVKMDSIEEINTSQLFKNCGITIINIPSTIRTIYKKAFNSIGSISNPITINIDKPAGSVADSPWGCAYATINWTG